MALSWEERILLCVNIEYLWRCLLLAQDRVLSNHTKILKQKLDEQKSEFDSDKKTYLDLIYKMKSEISKLKAEKEQQQRDFEGIGYILLQK